MGLVEGFSCDYSQGIGGGQSSKNEHRGWGFTSKMAPSHGCWHQASITHHVGSPWLLEHCHSMAPCFLKAKWSERVTENQEEASVSFITWPRGSHTTTFSLFLSLEISH